MPRLASLIVLLLTVGFVLAACAGGNAPDANPITNSSETLDQSNQADDPAAEPAPDPTIAPDLEAFQPTPSPLFEQSYRANPISDRDYSQYEIVTLLPPDAIPALSFPAFYKAERADREYLPDEMVIGVEFNGDAKAYPVEMLSRHEIVNDTVGGIHLAVTW